ncbi:NADH-quinone oxidoreductase subunit C [Streptomyces sp. DG2A-72]|uniref:NADH-quinone oxidoreductase subunit C n=1 Tax=Streptomyces sp. DG2A-72 TaxID=3051386 RepID=UPI00265C08E0|nr:NADH-quinone oxidoreductase subunit C [Streptomyces sp. DG2A-72]MDO0935550.1 NADH-quinone oxidoreductase subunit C [Streptomyces sp. DG2A-72]
MTGAVGWLPAPAEELFGAEATAEESYELLTVDVPASAWITALRTARDELGCTYFDWLSAVDEPGTGFRIAAHVAALSPVRRLLLRTTVPHEAPALPTAIGVYAGAAWHERETHEMFGVHFEGHPALDHLLLPETFEGHPLRKDFVLASRVVKAWPGAKEPGESEHGGPKRRQMLPPGVPDPNEWGPQKGQLPPAPARPARGAAARGTGERPARATRAAAGAGDRPVRRSRTASEGSASQTATAESGTAPAEGTPSGEGEGTPSREGEGTPSREGTPAAPPATSTASASPARPRRSRSVGEGSASQRTQAGAPEGAAAAESAADSASASATPPEAPRSADAPWHHARPAFDEPEPEGAEPSGETAPKSGDENADATPETPDPESSTPESPTPEDPAGGPQ